ncbi:hypothetical protein FE391_45320 [Nonomuraea sp. KC401]|uniref:hypothetical protein n=1 Tax=unclassified Nonomuraea TaxID=2593643 RepID=UPI0010FD7FA7|nr:MULTISPECIES: hypothetical protein [unclassified Nonomuraea]NBE94636.1 hypothetical protein [Nonomuraea sp. K271]TLF49195.1 hypothetical protein FE391_45320 [Nonomuraea sp. KC401]
MRRTAAVLLVCGLVPGLAACDDLVAQARPTDTPVDAGSRPVRSASPPPEPDTQRPTIALTCGSVDVHVSASPAGLARAGSFTRLESLKRRLKVKGLAWQDNDERLYVGVVCGVHTAEQFVTLVARSTLSAYWGKPALHWTTRNGLRNFMWLERPGTAVYIGATPGLAAEIRPLAAEIAQQVDQ